MINYDPKNTLLSLIPKTNDWLTIHLYFQYVIESSYSKERSSSIDPTEYYDLQHVEQCYEYLIHGIISIHPNYQYEPEKVELFIKEMVNSTQEKIDRYNWLYDDPRACNYYFLNSFDAKLTPQHKNQTPYGIGLQQSQDDPHLSFENKVKYAIYYLTSIILEVRNGNTICASDFNERLDKSWHDIISKKIAFDEIDRNDPKKIDWAWEYIIRYYKKEYGADKIHRQIKCDTPEDKYFALYAVHDFYFTTTKAENELFWIKFNRAFSQKKFREKEETTTINVPLRTNYKNKLDKMCKHYQYTQKKLLEILIDERYQTIEDPLGSDSETLSENNKTIEI